MFGLFCDNIIAMKVLIVGAGASGLTAAISHKRNHPKDAVLVIEHLSEPLKKLLATGNGRCNLGNSKLDLAKYSHPEFVEEVIKEYDYEQFFDSISVKTKLIDELAYPVSETAVSVRNALLKECEKLGIKINCNEELVDYKVDKLINVRTNKNTYEVGRLYLATSLCSGKNLGSDGSIIPILKKHNYKFIDPLPGLCPLITKEDNRIIDGIRNKSTVYLYQNNQKIFEENGEVLFRKNGLSGIVIFNASRLIAQSRNKPTKIVLDLLPSYSLEEIENYCNLHGFDGFLQGFLNPKIIHYLLTRFGGTPELIKIVKNLEFNFLELSGFDFSQVSVGGVDISEVNSSLESKKEKGVYFLGELLDIDGPCGGYNLTFAFASALKATK